MTGLHVTIGHRARRLVGTLPAEFRVLAWMGGIELNLTAATPALPGGSTIEAVAVMGIVTVHVAAGQPIVLLGDAVTWSADAAATDGWPDGVLPVRPAAPGVPVVRIRGRAVLGTVHVRFRAGALALLDRSENGLA